MRPRRAAAELRDSDFGKARGLTQGVIPRLRQPANDVVATRRGGFRTALQQKWFSKPSNLRLKKMEANGGAFDLVGPAVAGETTPPCCKPPVFIPMLQESVRQTSQNYIEIQTASRGRVAFQDVSIILGCDCFLGVNQWLRRRGAGSPVALAL